MCPRDPRPARFVLACNPGCVVSSAQDLGAGRARSGRCAAWLMTELTRDSPGSANRGTTCCEPRRPTTIQPTGECTAASHRRHARPSRHAAVPIGDAPSKRPTSSCRPWIDRRVGRVIREVRIRQDLAAATTLRRRLASARPWSRRIELGDSSNVSLARLRAVGDHWTSRSRSTLVATGELDRLVDRGHAALVEHVVAALRATAGSRASRSLQQFRERGSADIVAWHRSELVAADRRGQDAHRDVQATASTFERKVASAGGPRRETDARTVARVLVIADTQRIDGRARSPADVRRDLACATTRRGTAPPSPRSSRRHSVRGSAASGSCRSSARAVASARCRQVERVRRSPSHAA